MIGELFNQKIFYYIEQFSPAILGLVALDLVVLAYLFLYPDDDGKVKGKKMIPYMIGGAIIGSSIVAIAKGIVSI